MGYFFILCSAVCSIIIAHLLKATEVRRLRTLNTLTANYLSASTIAFGIGYYQSGGSIELPSLQLFLFAVIVGAFFITNFLIYSKSVHTNGVGITIAFMRLSLLVPILVSIYLYSEYLGWKESLGVVFVFGSMVLLIPKKRTVKIGKINAAWLLLFIFILAGFADASLKIYKEEFSIQINELLFMSMVFGSAFVIGLIISISREGPLFTKNEMQLGSFLGIPNLYSSIFLIWALHSIDGSIAYPTVNIATVIGGTLLGLWYWKDKVSKLQWIGFGIAITAILLLV
ncbi:MAG: DMT family transporter [Balneolaceae bacterium]|nr:DMT family transporter [Balneolaceae bacterium]